MPTIANGDFKKEVSEQELGYQIIAKECVMISASENENLKDNNWFDKAKIWTSIKLATFSNQSTSHLAEQMILGTTMGIIEMIRILSECEDADTEIIELAKKLLRTAEKNAENLKPFIQSN